MKPSSNVCGTTTKVPSKRAIKKQINISWNSKIFFQVGLIVSMLAVFFVMELEISKTPIVAATPNDTMWEPIRNIDYTVIKDVVKAPKVQPKKQVPREVAKAVTPIITQTFEPIANDSNIDEGKIANTDAPVLGEGGEKVIPTTTTIVGVEHVPVFPGCESAGDNNAKVACMSSKIRAFIAKRFNTGQFDYFEPGSMQTIRTFFTIDSNGNIVEIKARAKDKNLEDEARRVISILPVMEPGRQGDTAVNVTYAVPIHFKVNN